MWRSACVLALLACGGATSVQAREMDGRLGIGLEQSLSGVSGLSFRYFTGERLAILATVGLDMVVVEGELSAGVAGSVGAAFQLSRSEHAHLSVGVRLGLGYRSLSAFQIIDPTATESGLHFAIELPIGLELFLADNFSFGASTGILIDIVPDEGRQLHSTGAGSNAPPGGVGIGLGAGSLSATLSLHYYF